METKVSVIIPAHNEEKYIVRCMKSIKQAAKMIDSKTEIIVVCNRCTDQTAELAEENGARVLFNEDRCIAKVRNAGIEAARGETIVTIDADNRMTKGTIKEVCELLESGKFIGGGAPIRFERTSFALFINDMMCRLGFGITGLYCGMFWAKKESFDQIGGFVDKRAMEDVMTAKALKKLGSIEGKKYGCLKRNVLINSTRKYDDYGDWMYFKLMFENAGTMIKAMLGNSREYDKLIDKIFYDYND
ncbi:MAG: glycosyltransferase [Eubacteriales bacterium]|nr:glycosyltransferase [Eubacteriales bacterium]